MSVQDRISSLSPAHKALLDKLLAEKRAAAAAVRQGPPPIERVTGPDGAGDWPLSFDQERMWLLSILDPEGSAYNLLTATRMLGTLDIPALLAALSEIVRRQGALRTTFQFVDGTPVQRVAPSLDFSVPIIDCTALPPAPREAMALELVRAATRQPFSLKHGPIVRFTLIRLGTDEHICMAAIHHILSDQITFQLFWHELSTLYVAFTAGQPLPLAELPIQYADFAAWQRGWLQGETLANALSWWQERLQGFPQVLELPADRPRPARESLRGRRQEVLFDPGVTRGLRGLAVQEKVTRFMTVLALSAALFHRLSGQDRLILGTLNANRNRTELEPLFGYFLTQLPLAVDLTGDPSFREVLSRIRGVALGAYAHQELPFGKLVEAMRLEREPGLMPLVQVLIQLFDPNPSSPADSRMRFEPIEVDDGNSRYDLMLAVTDDLDAIQGYLESNAEIFDAPTTARIIELFLIHAAAAVADPSLPLSALPAFSPAMRQQMLLEWNDQPTPQGEPLLHRIVEQQAARTPRAVAVESIEDGRWLTYADLDEQAEELARRLRHLGVGPETRVALATERSPEMLVGLLGILKAGGAYVPLDPGYPQERLAFMREDSGAAVVLEDKDIQDFRDRKDDSPGSSSLGSFSPDSPAYLIYTSGSTGRPKGVVVPHRSIAAYTRTALASYEITPADRVLQFGSISFDTSAEEIWPALAGGARLILRSAEMSLSIERFLEEVERHEITVLNLQTAFWHEVVAGLSTGLELPPNVRLVIIGGEAALPDRVATWREQVGSGVRLVNTYGPTEATIVATRRDLTQPEDDPEVSIGRPIPGARVHLVDPRGEPVPPLAPGELLIGGTGVARGYLGRPDLTAERFIPDPWSTESGARLYRSGDLARFRSNGELLFSGRADRQLKLRGFRIEPGEIEAALRLHPALHDTVADLRGTGDDKRLIAWVVPHPGEIAPEGPALRAFLRERLPEPLVPAHFVPLAALPLTANGKLDRRALPEPAATRPELPGYAAPSTPLERTIAEIFRELLRVDRVGLHDNFFDLGGHSLLIVRAHQMLGEELDREIPVVDLFRFPTVAFLARHLGGADEPTFERVQSLAGQQRAAQQRQKQALEKLRRPGGAGRR